MIGLNNALARDASKSVTELSGGKAQDRVFHKTLARP
jgi:hypothetical protein